MTEPYNKCKIDKIVSNLIEARKIFYSSEEYCKYIDLIDELVKETNIIYTNNMLKLLFFKPISGPPV